LVNNGRAYVEFGVNARIVPSSLTLTWGDPVLTATDNGNGALTGAATGTVDYTTGNVQFSPNLLIASGTAVALEFDKVASTTNLEQRTAQGVAAGVDLLIGALEMPQASWAVTGGRIYSATAFGAMNDFMTKAMAVTGKPFDSEEFWRAFKESLTEGQRSVCDWIEYVPDKD
jgi:hypothetical protein